MPELAKMDDAIRGAMFFANPDLAVSSDVFSEPESAFSVHSSSPNHVSTLKDFSKSPIRNMVQGVGSSWQKNNFWPNSSSKIVLGMKVEWEMPFIQLRVCHTYRGNSCYVSSISLKSRFDTLSAKWVEETKFLSSPIKKAMNTNYQQIIGLGSPALPLIIDRLSKTYEQWFWALHAITGHNPILQENKGDVVKMTEDWLEWAVDKGLHLPNEHI